MRKNGVTNHGTFNSTTNFSPFVNEPLPPPASTPAHHALQRLQQAEHDLEARLEASLDAAILSAEQSLARRFGVGCLRGIRLTLKVLGVLLLLAYFAFGAALLVVRHAVLPHIEERRPQLEALASQALDAQVHIGRLQGGWQGLYPRLKLSDVRVSRRATPEGELAQVLVLPQVDATLSWSSLWHLEPRFHDLSVLAPELQVRRRADGRWLVAGFVIDPNTTNPQADTRVLDWVLGQQRITVRDARVQFVDETAAEGQEQGQAPGNQNTTRTLALENVQLRLEGGWITNRIALRATPPSDLAAPIDVRAQIERPFFEPASHLARWSGRVFVQTDFVDLARLPNVLRWLPGSMQLTGAQGALRTWVEFDHQSVRRVASDVALANVDVRLGADLAPLALDSARGRLAYREFEAQQGGGIELVLDGFSMIGRAVELTAADVDPGEQIEPRVVLPPTRLRLRWVPASNAQATRGEFEASLISLDQLSALAAYVPLGRELRAIIARHAVGGELTQLSSYWEGNVVLDPQTNALQQLPARYGVKTRFAKLSSAAVPADPLTDAQGHARAGLPGFQNLAGDLDINAQGGTMQLDAREATLEFPGVFEAPRKRFTRMQGQLQWSAARTDAPTQPFELQIQRLTLINPALNLTLTGRYRQGGKGAGIVDLSARVDAIAAPLAHEYLPLTVGADVRTWLRDALVAGTGTDGNLRLRGDLADFPFADGNSGEFRVSTQLHDGALNFAPDVAKNDAQDTQTTHWPVLRDLEADVVFERNRMHIVARQGGAQGVALTETSAQIADLGAADVRLQIDGKLRGPLAAMLNIVAQSPVGPLLGDVLQGASASGEAQGQLNLDIPLSAHTAHVGVKGAFTLRNNNVALRLLPPFTQASGQIEFTERSLRLSGLRAGFMGGQTQITADTQADGAIVFKATGSATPAGVRPLIDITPVQRALDRSTGNTRYSAVVTLREGRPDIRVESDLVGWVIDLPYPLGKLAATALPLRVLLNRNSNNAAQDRLQVNAGSVFALRVEREVSATDKPARVLRGAARISDEANAEAPVLPSSGVRLDVALARLDLDRWAYVLYAAALTSAGGSKAGTDLGDAPDLISARVRELRIVGKPIANVVLGASRAQNGAQDGAQDGTQSGSWQVNLESDQASGALWLRPAQAGQEARISARLARLTIPDAQRGELTELLDAPVSEMPALDVVADNFELGHRKLGHLELSAQNLARSGGGGGGGGGSDNVRGRDWQLQKLEIVNPDGKLSASGQWARDTTKDSKERNPARRMTLNFVLDYSNGGALLNRLGMVDALRGTSGKLEGSIAWRGSPFTLDWPSLSGKVQLNSEKGQFLKADAGAGRLLGVMSLQSIPRRLTLDFRDVFSQGFAFDSIRATADIQNGVLSTRDLRMRGVNATVLIEGSADLVRETQNLHVLVLPEINAGSASLLYAALANPAIGIGTFLAQLVLRDPLSKAFSFEYDITGAWADPQVKRRQKPPAPEAPTGSP